MASGVSDATDYPLLPLNWIHSFLNMEGVDSLAKLVLKQVIVGLYAGSLEPTSFRASLILPKMIWGGLKGI